MSEPAVDGPVVGVLGTNGDELVGAVESVGGTVVTGGTESVLAASPDLLLAVGESGLLSLATTAPTPEVPVLPVDTDPGVPWVPVDSTATALERVLGPEDGDDVDRLTYPVLGARVDGIEHARALADMLLVTAEPARISEYAVWSGDREVATFRADGVVVATPLGSHGYARAVGAPVLAQETGVVAVAPVAPFATDPDHWVLPADAVSLSVERDAAAVELLADDRTTGTVPPRTPVEIEPVDEVAVLCVPESRDTWTTPSK